MQSKYVSKNEMINIVNSLKHINHIQLFQKLKQDPLNLKKLLNNNKLKCMFFLNKILPIIVSG